MVAERPSLDFLRAVVAPRDWKEEERQRELVRRERQRKRAEFMRQIDEILKQNEQWVESEGPEGGREDNLLGVPVAASEDVAVEARLYRAKNEGGGWREAYYEIYVRAGSQEIWKPFFSVKVHKEYGPTPNASGSGMTINWREGTATPQDFDQAFLVLEAIRQSLQQRTSPAPASFSTQF